MNYTLRVMGTASAMPISDRNPSAQMLDVHGRLFLIDCGEGTQQQIRRYRLSFLKIEAVFISHIHGDHVFGLFGLLGTMGMYGRTKPLRIYGPQAVGSLINFYRSFYGEGLDYEIVFTPVKCSAPVQVYESGYMKVSAFPLRHKIECYGWRFDTVGGPAQQRQRSYAYCSDTTPFPELASWVRGVDLLYHEATYTADMEDKAAMHFHSTTRQAAGCAAEAGVGKLLLGHYSQRIKDFDAYLKECTGIFPDSVAVHDGDVFEF